MSAAHRGDSMREKAPKCESGELWNRQQITSYSRIHGEA